MIGLGRIRGSAGVYVCAAVGLAVSPLSRVYGGPASEEAKTPPSNARSVESAGGGDVLLTYDDGTAEGRRSLGASGHGVAFKAAGSARWVESVDIFAARYGEAQAPSEFFHLYILNKERQVLADVPFAYGLAQRGDMQWYSLRTPSVEVPEEFVIALAFNPHQTKGIYLGYDESLGQSHSLTGLPEEGYEPVEGKYNWMVRAHLADKPSGKKGVRRLADWKPPAREPAVGGTLIFPAKLAISQDKQSYGGRGPAIDFALTPEALKLASLEGVRVKGFSLYASRYGSGYDPSATFVQVGVLDSSNEVRWEGKVPYGRFTYRPAWVYIPLPKAVDLAELTRDDHRLRLAMNPGAEQTKGIYFHYQKNPAASHSLAGTVNGGFQPVKDREWLMRIHLEAKTVARAGSQPAAAP